LDTYRKDQELPGVSLNWLDGTGATIDFSTGWTFTVKVCAEGTTTTLVTKTTGITGASTLPNVRIDWSTTDWSTLTAGAVYDYLVIARRTSDSKDNEFKPGSPLKLQILAAYT
jgi:hypothetical protein